jgi:hypothetical protein
MNGTARQGLLGTGSAIEVTGASVFQMFATIATARRVSDRHMACIARLRRM